MTNQQRIILVGAVAAIVGFAIGAVWQYASARAYAGRLEGVEHTLRFKQLETLLGAATIEAQRGSHEIGRQLASEFFTGLQQSLPAAEPGERQAFQDILDRRDGMITALSRGDPQSGPLLAQLFTRYRIARGEPVGPTADLTSPPPPAALPADSP